MTSGARKDVTLPPAHLPRRARRLLTAAYLLLVAAVLTDALSGPGTTVSPVLAAVPVLAGASTRAARVPLLAGLAAVVSVGLLAVTNRDISASVHVTALIAVVAATLASVANVVLVTARERELLQVRTVSEAAQRALLRPPPEQVGRVRIAVRYAAAAAEARIGGDLYDVVETSHGLRIILGDVQGSGLGVVETAADVLGVFRDAARTEPELTGLAGRLDAALARRPADGRFVTAILAGVPARPGPVELVNCGHPHPILRRAGVVTELEPPEHAPPLALLDLAGGRYRAGLFDPRPGDLLVMYTDGVSEARDAGGRFYPLAERLAALPAEDPDEVLEALLADVRNHTRTGLDDDAAMLALRWTH
ncbi:PP2C family protein-serine/threonine phosphatase [Kitasatospora herbaricolor]|uniref:Serine/threonine-protein phosphatase n=1 Tax=Kitasatospora herbaricolor TaxID=68217 RepID=A0ABZ1W3H7_9ACTN|nr:PP2C family protein-serine/threonine phosphatase [Kitasatospora herbaricolor]